MDNVSLTVYTLAAINVVLVATLVATIYYYQRAQATLLDRIMAKDYNELESWRAKKDNIPKAPKERELRIPL